MTADGSVATLQVLRDRQADAPRGLFGLLIMQRR